MAEYVPNTNTIYDSLDAFLAGENIPQDLHGYFEEYDPAREEQMEDEQSLASRKARFELNNQKRLLLSQSDKMGFATSGQMNQGMENLMSMFVEEQQISQSAVALDIEDTKRDWLNEQYSMAGTLANEITEGNRKVQEIADDIHSADSHWGIDVLDDYYNDEKERKFLKYMDKEGKSTWDNWKQWDLSDNKELKKSYNARKNSPQVQSQVDPGQ